MARIVDIQVDREESVGQGGFLSIRRLALRNRHDDGSLSRSYHLDFVERPYGLDAVAVALFARKDSRVEVLLRDCLRPVLTFGRSGSPRPLPDERPYLFVTEVVAGLIEAEDHGEEGLRRRAAMEVAEEAGYQVEPGQVFLLGAGTFLSPGIIGEKLWFAAVEIEDPSAQGDLEGDGSPMEEGATTRWVDLDAAIAACVAGEIEDVKTETALRRLREKLG